MKLLNWETVNVSDGNGNKIKRRAHRNVASCSGTEWNQTNIAMCKTNRFIFLSPHLDTTNVRHVEQAVTSHQRSTFRQEESPPQPSSLTSFFLCSLRTTIKYIARFILVCIYSLFKITRNKTGMFTTQVLRGSYEIKMYQVFVDFKLHYIFFHDRTEFILCNKLNMSCFQVLCFSTALLYILYDV